MSNANCLRLTKQLACGSGARSFEKKDYPLGITVCVNRFDIDQFPSLISHVVDLFSQILVFERIVPLMTHGQVFPF